jgi:hypothetical protein
MRIMLMDEKALNVLLKFQMDILSLINRVSES